MDFNIVILISNACRNNKIIKNSLPFIPSYTGSRGTSINFWGSINRFIRLLLIDRLSGYFNKSYPMLHHCKQYECTFCSVFFVDVRRMVHFCRQQLHPNGIKLWVDLEFVGEPVARVARARSSRD